MPLYLGLTWSIFVVLVFVDYKLLCARLGNEPAVHALEWNVGEIARRIYKLQCAFATRIQKIFRGLLGRNFIRLYRRERARLWRIQAAGTFMIQRTYRGWVFRMRFRRHREKRAKSKLMQMYLSERKDQKVAARKREQRRVLMQRYKKQRKEEVSARFTGKSPFGAANGRKMKAFSLTEYGKCTRFWLVGLLSCLFFVVACGCYFLVQSTHLLGLHCLACVPVHLCCKLYIVFDEWSVSTNNRGQES